MFRTAAVLASLALAACTTTNAAGENTFLTTEGATVIYTDASEPFRVNFRSGAGVKDYWCAAGRAATRVAEPSARIYRLTPPDAPAGNPVVFSLTPPPGGAQPTGLISVGVAGDSVSVAQAKQLCPVFTRGF